MSRGRQPRHPGTGLSIQNTSFTSNSHDVQDGFVMPGAHKVLRFDFLSYNAGSSDMVIGSPASRPDLFVWSSGHGHHHLKDFNEFLLVTAAGNLATVGYKQAFCAIDIDPDRYPSLTRSQSGARSGARRCRCRASQ